MARENHPFAVSSLAISGSLRAHSTNTNLLRALRLLAPKELEVTLYEEIALLPAFNPDVEKDQQIAAVSRFQSALRDAYVVFISTPEYAHGIPGSLRMRWIGSSGVVNFRKSRWCLLTHPRARLMRRLR